MIRRRSNGDGSLIRRSDGRWQGSYCISEGAGFKRRFVYGKTRDLCSRKLREALTARETGRPQPRSNRETVGRYLQNWMEGTKPTMRPRSWERNEEHVRLHLVPRLGAIPLAKLEAADIRRAYAGLLSTGLSASTVHRAHATLRTALQQAFKDGMLTGNVADRVEPPGPRPKEMVTLSPTQAQHLLEAAKGDRREALYVLAVTAGLRLGELLALRWTDVNLDAGTLAVTGTLSRIRGEGLRIGEPKSKRSRRRVELSSVASKP
ncbi:MAG: tyrosine recombinase XerC [Candidatus Dormibacteria bacterium]